MSSISEKLWHSSALPIPHGTLPPSAFSIENGELISNEADFPHFAWGEQVHGDQIAIVIEENRRAIPGVDALITNIPNLALIIKTADCLPIFLFDPKNMAIGLVHAGWRGVAAKIHIKTVERMTKEYGTKPQNIIAAIGPAIRKCHFEMNDPAPFADHPEAIEKCSSTTFVDLFAIVESDLRLLGVEKIDAFSAPCTMCDERFPSFRRDETEQRAWSYAFLPRKD